MRRERIEIVEQSESTDNPSINGRYHRFNLKLGKGAFKEVYKAFDTHEQIDVAWNSIDLSLINTQNDRKKIFKECEMLKRLNHPNILKITNQWSNHKTDKLCFITNFVQDGSLAKFFRKRQVNLLRVKQISKQILKALVYLHNNAIIHRDIKCDNIFIEGNTGKVVVGDLGLSCNIISASSIVGTPHWMAPEIFKEEYDEMVDIWSFGMCVLELITSCIPYSECKGAFQVYQNISAGKKPESLQKINDASVRAFINICLNINPKMRPSASELLEHPFLYHRSKDIILCSELMKPKRIHMEPAISIEEKKEEEIMNSILNKNKHKLKEEVRVKKVENNGDSIRIKLKIICSKFAKPMHVEFDFNYKCEKPYSVAEEMCTKLKFPNYFICKVEKAIEKGMIKATKQTVVNRDNNINNINDANRPPSPNIIAVNNNVNTLQTSVTSLTASVSSQMSNIQQNNNNNNNNNGTKKMILDPMYAKPMDKIFESGQPIDYLTQSINTYNNNNNTRESIKNPLDDISSIGSIPQPNTQQLSSHSDINISQPISTAGNTSISNSIQQQTQISYNVIGEYNNNNIYKSISPPKSTTPPSSPPIIAIQDHNHSNIQYTNTKSRSTSPIIPVHTPAKNEITNMDTDPNEVLTPGSQIIHSNIHNNNINKTRSMSPVHTPAKNEIESIVLSDGLMALQCLNNKSQDTDIFRATLKLSLVELEEEFVTRNKLYNESEGKVALARKLVNILREELMQINNLQLAYKKEQTPDSIFSAKSTSIESQISTNTVEKSSIKCDNETENILTLSHLSGSRKSTEIAPIKSVAEIDWIPFEIEELKLASPNNDIIFDEDIDKKQFELHNEYIDFIQRKHKLLQLRYVTLESEIKMQEEMDMKNKINEKRNELIETFSEWLDDREQIAQLKSKISNNSIINKLPIFDKQLNFESDSRFVALMKSKLNDNDKQKCKIEIQNYRNQMMNNYKQFVQHQENKLTSGSDIETQSEYDGMDILTQLEHITHERVADSMAFKQFINSMQPLDITYVPKDKIKSCLGSNGNDKNINNSVQNGIGNNINQNGNISNNGSGSGSGDGSGGNDRNNEDNKDNDNKENKDGNINLGRFKFGKCRHANDCVDCSERIRYTKHLENIIAVQSQHIVRQSQYHTSFQQIIMDAIKHSIYKKKYKSKNSKKKQRYEKNNNGFEPVYGAENCIKISRKFTQQVGNYIVEPVVNIYNWISKTISLQYNDGQINKNDKQQVIKLDLHDKMGSELYGVIRSVDKKCNFNLWMDEKLYTEKEMKKFGGKMPKSSRDKLEMKQNDLIKEKLNMENMKEMISKCNWNEIAVFKCVNNTQRMTLGITKRVLCEKLNVNSDVFNGNLVPILMFKDNKHWIENVWIVQIDTGISIGIAFRYGNNGIEISGLHLNKKQLEMKHELIMAHKCNCFDVFKEGINDIYIGDPNGIMNQMKTYKKKYMDITPLIYTLMDAKYLKEYKSVQKDAIILMKHENGNLEKCIFNKPVNYNYIYSPLSCYSSPANSSVESININNKMGNTMNNYDNGINMYGLMQYQNGLSLIGNNNQSIVNGNIYQNMFNVNKLSNNNNNIILNNLNSQMNNKF